jgi:hypothetical protein
LHTVYLYEVILMTNQFNSPVMAGYDSFGADGADLANLYPLIYKEK